MDGAAVTGFGGGGFRRTEGASMRKQTVIMGSRGASISAPEAEPPNITSSSSSPSLAPASPTLSSSPPSPSLSSPSSSSNILSGQKRFLKKKGTALKRAPPNLPPVPPPPNVLCDAKDESALQQFPTSSPPLNARGGGDTALTDSGGQATDNETDDENSPPELSNFGRRNWTTNPFGKPDSEDNIQFEEENTSAMPKVKGGTLEKLVERVTYPDYPDPNYQLAFLLTYRSFTTPTELLELLRLRYDLPKPDGLKDEDEKDWKAKHLTPVRLRVFNMLRNWINTHFYDFSDDKQLIGLFEKFIDHLMTTDMARAGESLAKLLKRQRDGAGKRRKVMAMQMPEPILLGNFVTASNMLLSVHPKEIARQLTLIEQGLYTSIKPWECLNQLWNKRPDKAPHIRAMIQRFNEVSGWVRTEILKVDNHKERVQVLTKFIQVAEKCLALNNLNAAMEIVSGLQDSAVFRLKPVWNDVPKKQAIAFEEINQIVSRDKNYQTMRTYLKQLDPPCIPYLGVYLTDLTFIEDGMSDSLGKNKDLINFHKRRAVSQVIAEVQQYQQTPYYLEEVPILRDFLCDLPQLSQDDCWDLSLKVLSRGANKAPEKKLELRPMADILKRAKQKSVKERLNDAKQIEKRQIAEKEKAAQREKQAAAAGDDLADSSESGGVDDVEWGELEMMADGKPYPFLVPDIFPTSTGDVGVCGDAAGSTGSGGGGNGFGSNNSSANNSSTNLAGLPNSSSSTNLTSDEDGSGADCTPPFEGGGSGGGNEGGTQANLILEPGTAKPTVLGGTLIKLVERLSHERYPDPSYMDDFLLTYRCFCSWSSLIDLLQKRYRVPKPRNASPEMLAKYYQLKEAPVQFRVFNVLKQWVHKQASDFSRMPELTERMHAFIKEEMTDKSETRLKSLAARLDQIMSESKSSQPNSTRLNRVYSTSNEAPPAPYALPSTMLRVADVRPVQVHPEELARQMSLIEMHHFRNMEPWEPVEWVRSDQNLSLGSPDDAAATGDDGSHSSLAKLTPMLWRMLCWNDTIKMWVISQVLECATPRDRGTLITHFIKMLQHCRLLRSFNLMSVILEAIQSDPLKLLVQSWEYVPTQTLEHLSDLCSMQTTLQSYADFTREMDGKRLDTLQEVDMACVPPLRTYLERLRTINDSHDDFLEGGLISFAKWRKIGAVIWEMAAFHHVGFALQVVPILQEYFSSLRVMTDEEILERSLVLYEEEETQRMSSRVGIANEDVQSADSSEITQGYTSVASMDPSALAAKLVGMSDAERRDFVKIVLQKDPVVRAGLQRVLASEKGLQLLVDPDEVESPMVEVPSTDEIARAFSRYLTPRQESLLLDVASLKTRLREGASMKAGDGLLRTQADHERLAELLSRGSKSETDKGPTELGRRLWTAQDDTGLVYGWPEHISLQVATGPAGDIYLIHEIPAVDRAAIGSVNRMKKFYTQQTGDFAVSAIITRTTGRDARSMAKRSGVLLMVVSTEEK
eukprot:TRINITY_DN6594_c0_g1_i1.p1 TRINITY_DN6594_c0_g1~~TRINITY_DN6594_c0_g1_i1.p1  ORF type:complete len:1512 (+),score=324.59 TRINITY_DN6594_c0_g1_i1:100-4536(+)